MPLGALTGRDISIVSLARAASRAVFSSCSFLASTMAAISFLRPFSAGPMTFFSSIDILPRPCIILPISPFFPRAATRISSSARRSLAASICAAYLSLTALMSLMGLSSFGLCNLRSFTPLLQGVNRGKFTQTCSY